MKSGLVPQALRLGEEEPRSPGFALCTKSAAKFSSSSVVHVYSSDIVVSQSLGYHHCQTVVSGWQKSQHMKHIFTGSNEEERESKRRQHLLEKFEVRLRRSIVVPANRLSSPSPSLSLPLSFPSPQGMAKRRSSSVRDLAALASQIPRIRLHSDEDVDGMLGYWSSPEVQVST